MGVRGQSSQRVQFDRLELDGFAVAMLGVWYRLPLASSRKLRFQVNVDNLFDKEYYVRASDRSIVHPGAPFSVIASVGFEF